MPPEVRDQGTREFTLPPGSYVYVQDGTNGRIKTHTGPTTVTLTKGDAPIVYDGKGRFVQLASLEEAVRKSVVAPEGFYIEMTNPADGDVHPQESEGKQSPNLKIGHKIIVQGPAMFALWPGQSAEVVRGHNLRSNQYVLLRVYNSEEAKKNWKTAVIVKATEQPVVKATEQPGVLDETDETSAAQPVSAPAPVAPEAPVDLTVGKLLVIKGTDVSFYIPPTGVTVVQDEGGNYVREAVTLEQLEYSILTDENGKKRIPRGPAVVFPTPTETFFRDKDKNVKFRAIELNAIQGIHVKVTQPYTDPVLGPQKEGEELFITGKEYPIYFPREEHALIRYDGKPITYAAAIPEGDGRYLLDRMSGKVRVVRGATMLLPNPIHEIVVQRPLSEKQCLLWYPGNSEVLAFNEALRHAAATAPTTRAGTPSTGDVARSARKGLAGTGMRSSSMEAMSYASNAAVPVVAVAAGPASFSNTSAVGIDTGAPAGEEISRSSSYTQPRTLTLGSKYWVPKIDVWTGYAVEVVNSRGQRRVVEGPQQILLEFDEVLESLSLSTGKPKTTDTLLETPYLLVKNNKVADIIVVQTADFVDLEIKISYKVDFDGSSDKWFSVGNYIKFLCDYGRSALKSAARKMTVEDLYANYLEFVRKNVLGADLAGHTFTENGMAVKDVEVLAVTIPDQTVANMIKGVQREVVAQNIKVSSERKKLSVTKDLEAIRLEQEKTKADTEKAVSALEIELVQTRLEKALAAYASERTQQASQKELASARVEVETVLLDAKLAQREKSAEVEQQIASAEQELHIRLVEAETKAVVNKLAGMKEGLAEALLALTRNDTMVAVAKAFSVQQMLGGNDVAEVFGKLFRGTSLEATMQKVLSAAPQNGAVVAQPKQ